MVRGHKPPFQPMSKIDDISSSDTWSSESDGSYEADFVDKTQPDIDLSHREEPPEGYLQGGRATGGLRRYQNSLANLIYNIERQHTAMQEASLSGGTNSRRTNSRRTNSRRTNSRQTNSGRTNSRRTKSTKKSTSKLKKSKK